MPPMSLSVVNKKSSIECDHSQQPYAKIIIIIIIIKLIGTAMRGTEPPDISRFPCAKKKKRKKRGE